MGEPVVWSVRQLAARYQISRQTVYRLVRAGTLVPLKFPGLKRAPVRFDRAAVELALEPDGERQL